LCVASGVTRSTIGGVTRTIIYGNFDNIVKGAIHGAVRGLLGGIACVLVGTTIPIRFGIAARCKGIIIINAASVCAGIGAFLDTNKCSETPLSERRSPFNASKILLQIQEFFGVIGHPTSGTCTFDRLFIFSHFACDRKNL
jgi:hypothetical protein